jgi:predicted alpha/beta superfamily hydrolase
MPMQKKKFIFMNILTIWTLLLSLSGTGLHADMLSKDKISSIRSDLLKEDKLILTHTPPGYNNSKSHYPVIFVLDGFYHFEYVTSTVRYLSERNLIPEMIVIGVSSTDRARDLLPLDSGGTERKDSFWGFYEFLGRELIPWVDKHFRTSAPRILYGHSFAGLYTLTEMAYGRSLFDAYIAVSPSVYFSGHWILGKFGGHFNGSSSRKDFLYFSIGGKERTDMIEGNRKLERLLNGFAPEKIDFRFEFMENEDHDTIQWKSFYNGILFMYRGYTYPALDQGCRLDFAGTKNQLNLASIIDYYRKLSVERGFEIAVPVQALTGVAYKLLSDEFSDIKASLEIMRYNTVIHPDSPKAFFHCGRIFELCGRKEEALQYYKQAENLLNQRNDITLTWMNQELERKLGENEPRPNEQE